MKHPRLSLASLCMLISVSCLGLTLSAACLTFQMSGSPSPPTYVANGTGYTVTVGGIPASNNKVVYIRLSSASGDSIGPTNGWQVKGDHFTTGTCNQPGIKTFNVANYDSGYYWWRGEVDYRTCDNGPTQRSSNEASPFGYYWTP